GLVKAATGRSRSAIELLLARRFPESEMLPIGQLSQVPDSGAQDAPARAGDEDAPARPEAPVGQGQAGAGTGDAPARPQGSGSRAKLKPVAFERYLLTVTIDQATHDELVRAQELQSHGLPSGDIAEVLHRA